MNLYESSWTPGPEFDFRLLGSLDGDRSDGVIIQQVVKLEKATTLNDIVSIFCALVLPMSICYGPLFPTSASRARNRGP